MKRFRPLLALTLGAVILVSCSKSSDDGDDEPQGPTPGSKRTVTVDVTYLSGKMENSTSYATWPVVIFPIDADVKSYSVRLFNFNGTASAPPEGITYTWKPGEMPPTPYNVYPSTLDIKDGKYYMCFGRTWCSGCTAPNPTWLGNYQALYGAPKGEVTYQY